MSNRLDNNGSIKKEVWPIIIMIFLGVLIKAVAVIMTPYDFSPHDLGEFPFNEDIAYGGHLGYIGALFNHHQVPGFDPRLAFAFYNPPLHYILSALFMFLLTSCGMSVEGSLEGLQWLTLFYVTVATVFSYKTLKLITQDKRIIYVCTGILSLHPSFIYMATSLNNDAPAYMFSILTIYYTILWFKSDSDKMILRAAFTLGLGMFTKLNVVMIAPAMAFLFLVRLVQNHKDKKALATTIKQYAVFALVSIPVGTMWSIRNLIAFGLPLGFVDVPKAYNQFIEDGSFVNRFIPHAYNFSRPYIDVDITASSGDTCIWLTTLKSSLFDFCSDHGVNANLPALWGTVFLIVGLVVLVAWLLLFFLSIPRSFKNKDMIAIFAYVGIVAYVFAMVLFCYKFPFACSQDFRYIAPVMLLSMIPVNNLISKKV